MNRHIRRLKRGAALATTVAISLTPALVAAPSANAAAPVPVTRIAGANRFGTAAAIAEKAFPAGASTVIVATGFNFPDALAGNYLAGVDKAPILLVNVDNVPSETSAALQTLKAKNVIILGQTNAVDTNTENQLKSAGYTTSRIGGATRLETMQMIDEAPNATTIGMVNGKKTALLARADNFPDALGGGPVAYSKNFPVILTATNALSPQAQDVITKDGIQQVIILGGNLAVSSATESQANAAGAATLFRANGVDRSDTSRLLGEYELSNLGFVNTSYGIASGDQNYTGADALASGPFSGGIPQPTLVTNSINDPGTLVQWGQAHNANATTCYAFGGPIPLPDSTVNAVCNATPASTQSLAISPTSAATQTNGTSRSYTVTGLDNTKTYDIQLFNCNNVQTSNGSTTFTQTVPPSPSNNNTGSGLASPGSTTSSVSSVNGTSQAGTPAQVLSVSPQGGTITFTVAGPSTATAPSSCVVPVVFQDANNNGQLDVNPATGSPTEPFGAGGSITSNPAAAANGQALSFTYYVASLNNDAGTFVGCTSENRSVAYGTSGAFGGTCNTFQYGNTGDTYAVTPFGASSGQATNQPAFAKQITTYDAVHINECDTTICNNFSGVYSAGGPNQFELVDTDPIPPSSQSAAAGATNATTGAPNPFNTVTVTFPDSATPTAQSYNVYRALNGTASATCPAFPNTTPATPAPGTGTASTPYAVVGTVTDSDPAVGFTPGGKTYTFNDPNLSSNTTYCYVVSVVQANDEHAATAAPAQVAVGSATPVVATPQMTNATITATSGATPGKATITYNEAVFCGSNSGPNYTYSNSGGTGSVKGATCAQAPAGMYNGSTTDNSASTLIITFPTTTGGSTPTAIVVNSPGTNDTLSYAPPSPQTTLNATYAGSASSPVFAPAQTITDNGLATSPLK